jgi:endoglucanase
MRPKCAPSSAPESCFARRAFARAGSVATFLVAGCAPVQAEVGSDPPLDSGATVGDGVSPGTDVSDAAANGRCDARAPLRLYYWNLSTAGSSTDINYIVKVANATGAAIPLSSLEIRYYFTNELGSSAAIDVFYTDTCCSNKKTDFEDGIRTAVKSWPSKPSADSYLHVTFVPSVGNLEDGDAVQVEIAFHEPGYTKTLTQTNDYSYAAIAGGTQAQWNDCPGPACESKFTSCALTVHQNAVLVWGTPP